MSPGFVEFAALFGERFFLSLACYIDEGGTHDPTGTSPGSDVAVMAGCLADKDVWSALEKPWKSILDKESVPFLHMSDFNAQEYNPSKSSPYYGWSRDRRSGFIQRLCDLVGELPIYTMCRGVHVEAYDLIVPPAVKAYFGHPWMWCYWMLMAQFMEIEGTPFPGLLQRGEEIAFFFDQQDEFRAAALEQFMKFKEGANADGLFGGIAFEDKRLYLPLQVSDLIAFRVRKIESRTHRENKEKAEINPGWDHPLFAPRRLQMSFYRAEELRNIMRQWEETGIAARLLSEKAGL